MNLKTKFPSSVFLLLFSLFALLCCSESNKKGEVNLIAENNNTVEVERKSALPVSQEFKDYWYTGEAELTSYTLKQARYGELREGHAVLVYVTEPFLRDKQVKADNKSEKSTSVLKLNSTKKYLTGIYPYSIMSSTFYPVSNDQHAIKISNSIQEWCGHVYAQLNNRDEFNIMAHSYFEAEGDQQLKLPKSWLENEFWTMLRIDPTSLPEGEHQVIPSLEYIRLSHISYKAYTANLSNSQNGDTGRYTVEYPELNRTVILTYNTSFPYDILGWKETFPSGFGDNAKLLTSSATKKKTIKAPYWQQNKNKDVILRDSLGL